MLAPLRVSAAACTAAVMILAVSAGGLSRPDSLIERSFAEAFSTQRGAGGRVAAPEPVRFDPAHLHLSRLPASTAGPALNLGDRITVAGRNGTTSGYEVIEVRPLAGDAAGEKQSDGARLLLVTAVSTGPAPAQTIRLVIDAGDRTMPAGTAVGARPHAL